MNTTQRHTPTTQQLSAIFDDAQQAHDILNMDIEQLIKTNDDARRRVNECYNRPTDADIRLHALNGLGGFYGVEGIEVGFNDYIDYLNAGYAYTATLLYYKGRFYISSWGDEVERINNTLEA